MKIFYSISLLICISFSVNSQIIDTCDYVHQNNQIGGLDCAMVSLAMFPADSYQWLNCDNSMTPILGDTSAGYSGTSSSINVALVIDYLGCIDTSYCAYVCTWRLEELPYNNEVLVSVVGMLGRQTEDKPNTLLIYLYSDGTKKKMFRIE